MGKMTSLLEKYKLIEKENYQNASTEDPSTMESQLDDTENATVSSFAEEEVTQESFTADHLNTENMTEAPTSQETNTETTVTYNKLLTIMEVYESLQLGHLPTTDTVFLLENLIKALPEELPEFVKKTTINNIIEASAINLPKLLDDGQVRIRSMERFSTEYNRTHSEDITALKSEISRLSAIIADYNQQIKHKETLISEETSLIQTEQTRIQSILEFFK